MVYGRAVLLSLITSATKLPPSVVNIDLSCILSHCQAIRFSGALSMVLNRQGNMPLSFLCYTYVYEHDDLLSHVIWNILVPPSQEYSK